MNKQRKQKQETDKNLVIQKTCVMERSSKPFISQRRKRRRESGPEERRREEKERSGVNREKMDKRAEKRDNLG